MEIYKYSCNFKSVKYGDLIGNPASNELTLDSWNDICEQELVAPETSLQIEYLLDAMAFCTIYVVALQRVFYEMVFIKKILVCLVRPLQYLRGVKRIIS